MKLFRNRVRSNVHSTRQRETYTVTAKSDRENVRAGISAIAIRSARYPLPYYYCNTVRVRHVDTHVFTISTTAIDGLWLCSDKIDKPSSNWRKIKADKTCHSRYGEKILESTTFSKSPSRCVYRSNACLGIIFDKRLTLGFLLKAKSVFKS